MIDQRIPPRNCFYADVPCNDFPILAMIDYYDGDYSFVSFDEAPSERNDIICIFKPKKNNNESNTDTI